MQTLQEIWYAAEESATKGDLKSANFMRLFTLANVLAAAETAILVGDARRAVANLHELERYTAMTLARLEESAANET